MSNEKHGERKLIREIVRDVDPSVKEAKKKAEGIIERARFNEAVRVIDDLIREVETMSIPEERFSKTKKIFESVGGHSLSGGPRNRFEGETENDYKRGQLKRDLERVRNEILSTITKLEIIIMDMEATKQRSLDEDATIEPSKA